MGIRSHTITYLLT